MASKHVSRRRRRAGLFSRIVVPFALLLSGASHAQAPSAPPADEERGWLGHVWGPWTTQAPTTVQEAWELDPAHRRGVLRLLPYRPVYALIQGTTDINPRPHSPTRSMDEGEQLHLVHGEAALQLSFKTKVLEDVLRSDTDLWFAYTGQSYIQPVTIRKSSILRDTIWEPEAMVVHALQTRPALFDAAYVAVSLNHQSNGRGGAFSRGWNRWILDTGGQVGAWSLRARTWVRAFDIGGVSDDNNDIADYVGRLELSGTYRMDGGVISVLGRHTLRTGDQSRGSAQVDWAFPLAGKINAHLQFFTGYGQTLIDYNHRQTTVGIGISVLD